MANITSPLTITTTTAVVKDYNNRSLPKTSQGSLLVNPIRHFARKVSCNATNNDSTNNDDPRTGSSKIDRRNMLLGIGGLYGAATTLGGSPSSLAEPALPDLKAGCSLTDSSDPTTPQGLNCCPYPIDPSKVVNFDPRNYPSPALKVRPAAHMADAKYIAKYQKAIQLMKDLEPDDPRNFFQQAVVHCTYCNGGYSQVNFNDELLQVHFSWLFFPFHRAYLYFFERILGKLIGDPNFAMPYWNWDHPDGMRMPAMYTDGGLRNPLFNPNRNASHRPPKLLDLAYDSTKVPIEIPDKDRIVNNLNLMYKQVVDNNTPELFMGQRYVAGPKTAKQLEEGYDGSGSLEALPHNNVHDWTGDPTKSFRQDMGTFFSAGRDPIFYGLHSNVDRMWTIWKGLDGNRRRDFTDPDWLNASFVLYDENAKPVRIYVRDVLDDKKLGYSYQDQPLPWLERPEQVVPKPPPINAEALTFPRPLGQQGFRTKVTRPKKSRSQQDKNDYVEILEVKVATGDTDDFVKFDVYINDPDDHKSDPSTKATVYFGGSFSAIPLGPNRKGHKHSKKFKLKVPLNKILERIGADGDDTVVATLVPQSGQNAVTINDVKIKYI